jgi:cytochrome c oxidase cbb3-type subunit I/II
MKAFIATANDSLLAQAGRIADNLAKGGIEVDKQKEIIAVIAYLQRLGTDIKVKPAAATTTTTTGN